jgi:hypothetical protein
MYPNAQYADLIVDAIEIVLSWDVSDECLPDAVIDRARLMAGANSDNPDDTCLH